MENQHKSFIACPDCKGIGKKSKGLGKKAKLAYQAALEKFVESNGKGPSPVRPKGHLYTCTGCGGSGILPSANSSLPDNEIYPHVAIIGAGIGGVALAVACLHRGIPFTLYERDLSFDARSQGYGLTLQQASRALVSFGITKLSHGVVSTRHLVHNTDGQVIGEWGMRKYMPTIPTKQSNIHIARQSLRLALLEQLGGHDIVHWGHKLIDFSESGNGVELRFEVGGKIKTATADLIVGADGIRSAVRSHLIGEKITPLRYLDCIVMLGICPLGALEGVDSSLLDSATVFQTANGKERIYMMPFTANSIMWQLSFPIPEEEAKSLSAKGPAALKEEAIRRTQWHSPIPQILAATPEANISGYPVYDRKLISTELLAISKSVTIIGDAAHPMSPFKGQGANQALLDALSLARSITKGCRPTSEWRKNGIRENVLTEFEAEMLERSATKVKDSAEAAQFLHSNTVLHESDSPRGKCRK